MPNYTPTILVATELDAVNACLVAGGEAPVSTVVTQRPDVLAAQQLVREASREVQSTGWRFNTEHGFEILPAATMTVTDSAGTTETLNVFTPPVNLLSFDVTNHPLQQGGYYLDTVVRPSRQYLGGGTQVFYDRTLNRDGHLRKRIFIDPVWLFDFSVLPTTAKSLITLKAKRAYLAQIVQEYAAADRLQAEEQQALAAMLREEGETDDFNVFNNLSVAQHQGGRTPRLGGVIDYRATRGPA